MRSATGRTRTLTARQRDVLCSIRSYQRTHGFPPTVRELTRMLGVSSTYTVTCHLRRLAVKGRVTWLPGQSRTLRVVGERRKASGVC